MVASRASSKSKKTVLLLIALLCIVPIALAYALFMSGYRFSSLGTTNYGTIIEPMVPLSASELAYQKDRLPLKAEILKEHFSLLYVLPAECVEQCQNQIHMVQQIQIALGQYQDRLFKFVIALPTSSVPGTVSAEAVLISTHSIFIPSHLYVMDPNGNIILSYPSGWEGMRVLKDIKHLIKLSTTAR